MSDSRLSINHWRSCCHKQRVTSKQLKQILLDDGDWIFRNGQKCSMKRRSMGAGVYEIWFDAE